MHDAVWALRRTTTADLLPLCVQVPRTLPAGSWGRRTLVTEAFDIGEP